MFLLNGIYFLRNRITNFRILYFSQIEMQVKVFGFKSSMLRPCGLVIAPGTLPILSELSFRICFACF